MVVKKEKEKDFWQRILKKNEEFRTEIFNGNNPIWVPSICSANEYEKKYIKSTEGHVEAAEKRDAANKAQLRKVDLEVNLLMNSDRVGRAKGYGQYEKQSEIADMSLDAPGPA